MSAREPMTTPLKHPRTDAELRALPEGDFSESAGAVWHEDDEPVSFTDEHGRWMVDRDNAGRWFKRRV